MGILSWIVFGIIAGMIARFIKPGLSGAGTPSVRGVIMTMLLGIVGAVVGGWIATLFGLGTVDGFNISSFAIAVVGALIVLIVWGAVTNRRKKTT